MKTLKYLLLLETFIIVFVLILLFKRDEHNVREIYPFNTLINNELRKILTDFSLNKTPDSTYKFIVIQDISLNSDTVIYNITFENALGLISNDLTFNVICGEIGTKKIIFRPNHNHAKNFKTVDNEMQLYLNKIDRKASKILQTIIEDYENGKDRDVLFLTGPSVPSIIVKLNCDGRLL